MKFYAVKNGRETGIFKSWEETEKLVKGYPEAKYKSFKTRAEAEQYLNDEPATAALTTATTLQEPKGDYAYVDGSFNPDTNTYGYGGFLSVGDTKYPIQGAGNDSGMAAMRNVAGEIEGALCAARMASELGLRRLTILYDYKGIEEWVTGGWSCKKEQTAKYRDQMRDIIANGLAIRFVKVAAHSGIVGNEFADNLAKNAVGIGA